MNFINLHKKIIAKLIKCLTTGLFRVIYYPYLHVERGVYIKKGTKIIPFNRPNKKLKIILKKNSNIKNNVIIQGSGTFILGECSFISFNTIVGVNHRVIIGNNVMISSNVSIRDSDHRFERIDIPMSQQGIDTEPIYIEDDVWICHGVVITKGVKISKGAIIGANSVVTKDIPKYAIAVGVPAKVIKKRGEAE